MNNKNQTIIAELQENYRKLQEEHDEQQKFANDVRKEATNLLSEIKSLTSQMETIKAERDQIKARNRTLTDEVSASSIHLQRRQRLHRRRCLSTASHICSC